jgi:hypothetical protein
MEQVFVKLSFFLMWAAGGLMLFQHLLFKPFLLRRLRVSHENLWKEIGAPKFFQSVEFSDDLVRLAKDSEQTASQKPGREIATYKLLRAYAGLDKAVMILLSIFFVFAIYWYFFEK